jgi:hypothetical protein
MGGRHVAETMKQVATLWNRPVMFTEFGYTTRPDPAVEPWLWPEHLENVVVDQQAQAAAYMALLAPLIDQPWFAGAFAWRIFSDTHDSTQEAEWGFSPQGKLAEQVLRSAFASHWATDPSVGGSALHQRARGRQFWSASPIEAEHASRAP